MTFRSRGVNTSSISFRKSFFSHVAVIGRRGIAAARNSECIIVERYISEQHPIILQQLPRHFPRHAQLIAYASAQVLLRGIALLCRDEIGDAAEPVVAVRRQADRQRRLRQMIEHRGTDRRGGKGQQFCSALRVESSGRVDQRDRALLLQILRQRGNVIPLAKL